METLQSPRLRQVRIIITSPERMGDQLTRFLAGRRPDLVCVDEVHEFGLAAAYRPSFLDVHTKIRQLGAPIVCATATACKRMKDYILNAFYSGQLTTPKIISESCSRKNICYQVMRYDRNRHAMPPMDAFAIQVEAMLTDQKSPWCLGAMMTFAHERKDCLSLCDILSVRLPDIEFDVFHGDMSPGERKNTLERFTSGKIKVLIGTQAIGCGFDYNGVSCVVHYGMAATSVQAYLQESGRAARPKSAHKCGLALAFFVPELHRRFVDLLENKDS
jgi:ATP-dependent DNA helicase RecQ